MDQELRTLVFKVCVSALWADEKMSLGERDFINNLVQSITEDETERDNLRKIEISGINFETLVPEVQALSRADKRYVFDECFNLIASDREITQLDLRFLKKLAKVCRIRGPTFWKKMGEARRLRGVKIRGRRRKCFLAMCLGLAAVLLIAFWQKGDRRWRYPKHMAKGRDFAVHILSDEDIAPRQRHSPEEVYEAVRKSVVTVYVEKNGDRVCSGTGTVIGQDAEGDFYILTNKHVVYQKYLKKECLNYSAQQYSGAMFEAKLDFCSRDHDLALLNVSGMGEYAEPMPMSLKKHQKVGQRVFTLGTPIGLRNTFTGGILSAVREDYLQTDATVFYGSSGGPLIDERGTLIGVVTATYIFKDYSFALPTDMVLEMLEERSKAKKIEQVDEGASSN